MQYNCTACHGARVGDEYLGNNSGIPGDVHWTKVAMTCAKCHGSELHGTETVLADRYHNITSPKCEDCHEDVWTTLSTIKRDNERSSRKHACNHCTDAACIQVCPTGALSYNDLGFVQYDKMKCSGCGYCVEFCPFGVPQLDGNTATGSAVMDKCTFCIDRVTSGEQPACAVACPTGAIKFGTRSELVNEGGERVELLKRTNPKAVFYGEKEVGGLHVMYVLDDSPQVYGLPVDPQLPAAAAVRDVFRWLGVGAVAAVVLGFGLNYIVARKIIGAGKQVDQEQK